MIAFVSVDLLVFVFRIVKQCQRKDLKGCRLVKSDCGTFPQNSIFDLH